MPPKRKRSTNLDEPEMEGLRLDVSAQEGEQTAPKKRGRKSIIDAILQEEGTVVSCRESLSDVSLTCLFSSQRNTCTRPTSEPVVRLYRPPTGVDTNNKCCQTTKGSILCSTPGRAEASLIGYAVHMGSRELSTDNYPLFHLIGAC
jgi:hypothetical protein